MAFNYGVILSPSLCSRACPEWNEGINSAKNLAGDARLPRGGSQLSALEQLVRGGLSPVRSFITRNNNVQKKGKFLTG